MILLDSSAWLAHLFGESGVEQINTLFDDTHIEINISALSLPEIYARLRAIGRENEWRHIWENYSALFTSVIPADETIALRAILLRSATTERLPLVDSMIAATAASRGLTLIHRDPHLAAIPANLVKQMVLPKQSIG